MTIDFDYVKNLSESHEGVEFKESTGQLDRGMETLCGMLNGDGGFVVFGVKNNGKIVGQEIGDKTTRMIGEALRRFEPAVDFQPKYIKITDSDKKLIVFEAEGNNPDRPFSYDDRIEIENAGMLPEDIPASQLTYGSQILDSHTSEPPNEIIARVMYYSGVIEHWGRGLSMIFEECNRVGVPQPTVIDEMGTVRVTFMRPNLSGQKNEPIIEPINEPIKSLTEVENIVLLIIKKNPGISRKKLVLLIDKSESTVRRALKVLLEMGFIEYRGSNKTGGYFIGKVDV